jgi:hypothetical protein
MRRVALALVTAQQGDLASMATWPSGLGKGLQSPVPGFDSRSRLQPLIDVYIGQGLITLSGGVVQVDRH